MVSQNSPDAEIESQSMLREEIVETTIVDIEAPHFTHSDSEPRQGVGGLFQLAGHRWQKHVLLSIAIIATASVALWNLRSTTKLVAASKRPPTNSENIDATVTQINQEFERSITSLGLQSAKPANWQVVARRLSLAFTGKGLSLEEYRALESLPDDTRLIRYTESLLKDSRTHDYLSERFARSFVGTNNGAFLLYRRRKFRLWLAEQLASNRRYDAMVRDMIAGEGLWTDQPEVNFITATMDEGEQPVADSIRLAGRTSRAFLGMRIDCLQCHDDFLGNVELGESGNLRSGTQQDFHSLAAFYSGTKLADFVMAGVQDHKQPYEYQYLDAPATELVSPAVPFRPDLLPNQGRQRARLAKWVTHTENAMFARATVNRVWAFVLGKPLVEPIDDIPIDGPFPPALETLAEDFSSHGYDLRRLLRIITRIDVFHRDSLADFDFDDRHESAWAVFPMTQLRPEQIVGALHQSSRVKRIDRDSSFISQLEQFGTINDFLKVYGDRGENEFMSDTVTVPQRLMVMNGDLVTERIEHNPIMNASTRISMLAESDDEAIELAFLSVLNQPPTVDQLAVFRELLTDLSGEDRSAAIGDIFWVLYNSTEFSWNH